MQVSDTVIRNPYYMGYENKAAEQSESNGNKSEKIDENDSKNLQSMESLDPNEKKHETSYTETLMHLFKGNVGPGCYAMGDAFKNGGLVLAPILTVILGIVCVHAQHVLVICSEKMKVRYKLSKKPDYADTIEMCFESGPERVRNWAKTCKTACNVFICVTQLGFCCIYFLFVSTNVQQVLDYYKLHFELEALIVMALLPIWLISLITNLKYLAPCSALANVCMISGISITFYYSALDLPPVSERRYVSSLHTLPLFFGTAIFAFEGIALVLPLQNSMRKPTNFSKICGVLNVGMVFVTMIFVSFGFIGYLKYGEAVQGALSLNLPNDEILAQSVKLVTALGVLLGYPLQFFVAIQIMFPSIRRIFKIADEHPLIGELIFRTIMVLVTFLVAELVPMLSLLLSLIGAFCSTGLALVFPPIIQMIICSSEEGISKTYINFKNIIILMFALLGFSTGTFESISAIVREYNLRYRN